MSFKRLAVLISGQGRNLQAIIDGVKDGRIPAECTCVISSRADAAGLERARSAGIAAQAIPHQDFADRAQFDQAVLAALEQHGVEFVALAGFMRVLGPEFLDRWQSRLVNIHPSLLPRHRGLHTHRRAIEEGDREHGASVHYVTSELDGGPVVVQGAFSVMPQDDEHTLKERVMREVELKIFPQALAWMACGRLRLTTDGVRFDGRARRTPLGLDDLESPFR